MHRILTLVFSLLALPLHAADPLIWGETGNWNQFESDFDENTKAWKEVQGQIPPYPKPENFVPISLGTTSSNRFFVDYASVTASEDGVVRYSIVVKSPAGAETISFEGMRCSTGERKLYAFGRSDGKGGGEWSRNRYPKWEAIQRNSLNDFRRVLFHHYFCTVEGAVKLSDIQRNLKSGGLYNGD